MYTFLIAALIVLGYSPYCSAVCSADDAYNACYVVASNDCPLYNQIMRCLTKAAIDCGNATEQRLILRQIREFQDELDFCPELADGKCVSSITNDCLKDTPIFNNATTELCQKSFQTGTAALGCLASWRPKCNTNRGISYLFDQIGNVMEMRKLCDKLETSS